MHSHLSTLNRLKGNGELRREGKALLFVLESILNIDSNAPQHPSFVELSSFVSDV